MLCFSMLVSRLCIFCLCMCFMLPCEVISDNNNDDDDKPLDKIRQLNEVQ